MRKQIGNRVWSECPHCNGCGFVPTPELIMRIGLPGRQAEVAAAYLRVGTLRGASEFLRMNESTAKTHARRACSQMKVPSLKELPNAIYARLRELEGEA